MKIQTANKQHICDSCGMPIPKGHRYWREFREGNGYDDPAKTRSSTPTVLSTN